MADLIVLMVPTRSVLERDVLVRHFDVEKVAYAFPDLDSATDDWTVPTAKTRTAARAGEVSLFKYIHTETKKK